MLKSRPIPFLVVGVMVGIFACAGLISAGVLLRESEYAVAQVTPVLNVVLAPTITATTTEVPETEEVQETITPTFIPAEAGVQIDTLVEIAGTEGEGLRFREEPGLNGKILFLAVENEVFEVQDGPSSKDGYVWWYLVNPYNPDAAGWAVANFIRLVSGP